MTTCNRTHAPNEYSSCPIEAHIQYRDYDDRGIETGFPDVLAAYQHAENMNWPHYRITLRRADQ